MEIEGRKVLITGASRGLGRTLAFAFAEGGAREVFAGARQAEDIEKLKSEAHAKALPISPIKLDVTIEKDIHAAAAIGFIDILVNNAGVAGYGDPLKMDLEKALEEMNVNYFGALRMARAFAPAMGQVTAARREAEARDYLSEIGWWMQERGLDVETAVVPSEHPADAILEESGRTGAAMIAMATHGRHGVSRLVMGSVAGAVLHGARVPLLLYRPAAEQAALGLEAVAARAVG